jgi:translation initiation factor 2 subunit 1
MVSLGTWFGWSWQDLYTHVGWPLYRKYGHAFEAFKLIVTDPDSVLGGLTKEVKEEGPDGQEVGNGFRIA